MPVPELDILKPIDPSISDSDDYEIFTLTNAHVVYEHNRRPASLLLAYADTPLTVTGRLEAPTRSQLKCLVKRPFKPVHVEVKGVTRFSYGQTEGGEIVLWALGEAGWFELNPSREWESVCREDMQAVGCLYFVTDIYNEPRKRGGGPSAQLIFQEYAEDERYECNDPTEAAATFHKHRAFLIMSFLNRAQGIAWSNTPLYQYYKRQFPKDFGIARARIEGRTAEGEKPLKAVVAPTKPRRARDINKADETPKKDQNWWDAAAIFEFMQKAVNHGAMHVGRVTLERTAKLLVKRYEMDEIDTAKNVLLVHATNLCYLMDHPRRKNVRFFASEPIYEQLSAGHDLSAADTRRAQSIELRPRRDRATLKETSSDSETNSSLATPPPRSPRKKRGRLSVLRPKPSKYSGKGKSVERGKGKGKAPRHVDADSESDGESASQSESDVQVDTPTQALSPGKRKYIPDVADVNPRKRAASASEPESEPQLLSQPQSPPSYSDEDESTTPPEPFPLQWRSANITKSSAPALLPPVIATPLPEYTANAPGDSWICNFDGCSQKVYGVSTELGRSLIKEHLEDHAKGRMKEIGLILSEEQKLRLPVNNLIKRIREMSEAQTPLFPSFGPSATMIRPSPIERRA